MKTCETKNQNSQNVIQTTRRKLITRAGAALTVAATAKPAAANFTGGFCGIGPGSGGGFNGQFDPGEMDWEDFEIPEDYDGSEVWLVSTQTSEHFRRELPAGGTLPSDIQQEYNHFSRDGRAPGQPSTNMDPNLLFLCWRLQQTLGVAPFFLSSLYRTPARNAGIKGAARNSQHQFGRAYDIQKREMGNRLWVAANAIQGIGAGNYNSFVHVDTRGHTARWGNR